MQTRLGDAFLRALEEEITTSAPNKDILKKFFIHGAVAVYEVFASSGGEDLEENMGEIAHELSSTNLHD